MANRCWNRIFVSGKLIEHLVIMDRMNFEGNLFDRLATEKYKTKSVTRNSCSTSVTWLEQFDFHLYEDQSHLLEINLHEKSSLGREESIAR